MRTIRIFLITFLASVSVYTAKADNDRPITVSQLPTESQKFIQDFFKGIAVSYAIVDRDLFEKTYEVRFVNGTKVEFKRNGKWNKVDCQREAIPIGIIPIQIEEYVKNNHPGQSIVKIDKDRRDYEIDLSNGIEIKFNRRFQVIGYDD
jgi:Protein of unknown function (DUF2874).